MLAPLLRNGALPSGDDTLFHLQFADGMARGLADGVLHPRWMSEANRGFGSAALMNYPPLGGYLVGATSLLTGDLVSAFHLVLFLLTALSGWAFYYCARSFATPAASLLATVLYLLAPYRLIDLHARFAFAEFLAFLWLPWLIKSLLDLWQRPSRAGWTGLVIASTGLVVTHVLTAYMVLVAVGPVVLWILLRHRQWRSTLWLAAAGGVVFALTAFYLMPLVIEPALTHTEHLTDAWWGDWRGNFLFSEPTSPTAVTQPIRPLVESSFWYSLALFLLSGRLARRVENRVVQIFVVAGAIAVFLQLSLSAVFWRLVPGMALLQFPWRFQSLLVLFSCLLLAAAATRIRWTSGLLVGAATVAAVLFAVFLWRGIGYNVTAATLETAEISRLVFKEHLPRGVEDWRLFERLPLDEGVRVITPPEATVEVDEWSSHRRELTVSADASTKVVLRTFYYPGWEAVVDGEPAGVEAIPPLQALGVRVPAGEHRLEVRFEPTPVRRLGSLLSVLTAAGLLLANLRRPKSPI